GNTGCGGEHVVMNELVPSQDLIGESSAGNPVSSAESPEKQSRLIRPQRGVSVVESVIAVTIITVAMGIVLPKIQTMIRNFRRDGAVQQIAGDVQKARAQSISTGWQYRILG